MTTASPPLTNNGTTTGTTTTVDDHHDTAATNNEKSNSNNNSKKQQQQLPPPAAWRLDPTESFSDLTIVLNKVTKYHVHRYVLVYGGIESSYFRGFLRNGGVYADKKEIHIDLDDMASRAFPIFLDYMYTNGASELPKSLFPEETVAMMNLGDYFGVPTLVFTMQPRLHQLLKSPDGLIKNLPAIIKYRTVPAMKDVYNLAVHRASEILLSKTPTTNLQQLVVDSGMDIKFFKEVLQLCGDLCLAFDQVNNKSSDKRAYYVSQSLAVSYFLDTHEDTLTEKDLDEITCERYMPQVAPEVALKLLEMDYDIRYTNGQEDNDDENQKKTGSDAADELTSLQQRCMDAFCINTVQRKTALDAAEAKRVFGKLPQSLLVNLLVPAVVTAREQKQKQQTPPPEKKKGDVGLVFNNPTWHQWQQQKVQQVNSVGSNAKHHSIQIVSPDPDLCVGSYWLTEDYGDVPFYKNFDGKFENKPTTFQLIRDGGAATGDWVLVLEASENIGVVLYRNSTKTTSSLPPICNWICESPRAKYPIFLMFQVEDCLGSIQHNP